MDSRWDRSRIIILIIASCFQSVLSTLRFDSDIQILFSFLLFWFFSSHCTVFWFLIVVFGFYFMALSLFPPTVLVSLSRLIFSVNGCCVLIHHINENVSCTIYTYQKEEVWVCLTKYLHNTAPHTQVWSKCNLWKGGGVSSLLWSLTATARWCMVLQYCWCTNLSGWWGPAQRSLCLSKRERSETTDCGDAGEDQWKLCNNFNKMPTEQWNQSLRSLWHRWERQEHTLDSHRQGKFHLWLTKAKTAQASVVDGLPRPQLIRLTDFQTAEWPTDLNGQR